MESYPYMILDQDYWLWVVTRILGEKESLIDQKFFILHSFVFKVYSVVPAGVHLLDIVTACLACSQVLIFFLL